MCANDSHYCTAAFLNCSSLWPNGELEKTDICTRYHCCGVGPAVDIHKEQP
jgi:hypothetical protein